MHDLAPLIYDLAIMLGVAAIVVVFFQRIRQPIVLGYLVAGMIIGPYTPPQKLVSDIPNIQILSELGVIFLMFALGLEFSFKKLTQVGFSASVTGIIETMLMIPIGYCAGLLLGWSHYDSLFLGAALSISSTTIIIKAIDELGLKSKRFASLIFGVLIVEDLLAILLLVALSIVTTQNVLSLEMLLAVIKLLIVVGGWFLIGYFLVPALFRKIAVYLNQETLTIVSVALCLFLVCVAAKFHYSTALGAFIMGSILAETVLIKRIEILVQPIRDIFAAVFFISVGMLINPYVIFSEWRAVLMISLVTVFGKILTTSIASLLTGQSLKNAMRVGFSMAQVGEFSFIIAGLGVTLGVTGKQLYPIIVAVSAVTTFTTPYLIRLSENISNLFVKHTPSRFHEFLDHYAAWVYRAQNTSEKGSFFRSISARLVINGIMVAIIFTFIDQVVYYKLLDYINDTGYSNLISLFLAIIAASPFIWGMLFSHRLKQFPVYAENTLNPAIVIIWLLTFAEIAVLSIVYFETWIIVSLILIAAIMFFLLSYKQLEKSYHWFEKQLLNNISQEKEIEENEINYNKLSPWGDSYMVEIEVDNQSIFAHHTLKDNRVRENFGVNIVGIYRGNKLIPAPRGDEYILPHDRLIVLGNDEQIDAFKKEIEAINPSEQDNYAGFFALQNIVIHSERFVGKSIRESRIRETVNGIIVGLERQHTRILNPDPDTVLQANDILFIVGEEAKFKKLMR